MGVTMGGSSLIQGLGQRDAAKQMNDIQRGIAKQNEANAIEAAIRGMESMAVKAKQQDYAAGQQAQRVRLQTALSMGRFVAGAAQAGIEGITQETIQSDFELQEAMAMQQIEKQQEFNTQANQQELNQLEIMTQGRINASAPNLQAVPSGLSIGLNALTASLSGAMMGYQMTGGGETGFFTGEDISEDPWYKQWMSF